MGKIYITTSIPYVNAEPHLGHALEFVQADCIARYQRLKGEEVFFATGTDENSLKNALSAEKLGISPQELVDKNSLLFQKFLQELNISFNDFIRTTEKRHLEGVKKFWQMAEKDIYQGVYQGLFCVGCEDFLKEEELNNGVCPRHLIKPEFVQEKNYFFRLSKYQKFLEEVYQKKKILIIPESRQAEIEEFLKEGLKDFSISRSQERAHQWGIPVPNDPSQVIYVWFDALCNYITVLQFGKNSPLFRAWWEDPAVQIWHFIGKDITKFHCLYWPAMLASVGLRLPNKIIVHSFLTLEGQKISKSLGNVIDSFFFLKEWGADPVRYYLLREFSLAQDGDFSQANLKERYNKELANGLGNLLNRVLTLIEKEGGKIEIKENLLEEAIQNAWQSYFSALDNFRFPQAAEAFLKLMKEGDVFLTKTQPWLIEEKEKKMAILSSLWLVLANLSFLIEPFLPGSALKIREALGLPRSFKESWLGKTFEIKKIPPLFPRK